MLQGMLNTDDADKDRTMAQLNAAEKRLGVKLPKSYREFILTFSPAREASHPAQDKHIGLLPADQIGFVRDLMPESVEIAEENPIESPDVDYFLYGVEQQGTSVRTSYLRNAILVGRYGDSMFEQILLYPQVSTQDGELETAIRFHASQFRAPSFAEMMRQWNFLENSVADSLPPYAQERLRGTCADQLTMRNVWWR